ncbi:MAG: hypothetical protein ACJ746_21455 [Bryobacteraceae bacterium]
MAAKPSPGSNASRKPLDLDQVELVSQLKERGLKPLELAHVTLGPTLNLKADPTTTDLSRSQTPLASAAR